MTFYSLFSFFFKSTFSTPRSYLFFYFPLRRLFRVFSWEGWIKSRYISSNFSDLDQHVAKRTGPCQFLASRSPHHASENALYCHAELAEFVFWPFSPFLFFLGIRVEKNRDSWGTLADTAASCSILYSLLMSSTYTIDFRHNTTAAMTKQYFVRGIVGALRCFHA